MSRRQPRELTVLYDPDCALCRSARDWLRGQPTWVPLRLIAAGSSPARRRYPGLDPAATRGDVTVVDDAGQVYRGAKAWVMCLWATRAHREKAISLSGPAMWPLAKRFIAWVSEHRGELAGVGVRILGGRR